MSVFGHYARYYDLLYRNKDYAGEAAYVDALIRKHLPDARSVLELGCGTGAHAVELAQLGYMVHGVDASAEMLARAESRWEGLSEELARPQGSVGDLRDVRVEGAFEVVLALFHVISYLPDNEDLQAGFDTAAAHLGQGGLFVFDFWYGPGVLTDPPVHRERDLEDTDIVVHRLAEPELMSDRNLVDVHYRIDVTDKATGRREEFEETHRMRYLFQPEIRWMLGHSGFEVLDCFEWMTTRPADTGTWNAVVVARRQ